MSSEDRQRTVREFAEALTQVRADAGNPSFRRMAQQSGCISHTTLHEAACGNRFPSWETTRQFLLVCGADPEQWRTRWQQTASRVAAGHGTPAQVQHPSPVAEASSPVPSAAPAVTATATPAGDRRWWQPAWVPIAIFLVAVLALTGLFLTMRHTPSRAAATPTSTPPAVAVAQAQAGGAGASCTPPTTAVPAAPPQTVGDRAGKVDDMSYPDCSQVKVGQHFVKQWSITNMGDVAWRGRFVQRVGPVPDADGCRTAVRTPIPDTGAGQSVVLSVAVTAAATPRTCHVKFQIVDSTGRLSYPGGRPFFFYVFVRD